jgi:hypothetical protein
MAIETYRGMGRDALGEAYDNRAVVPGWERYVAPPAEGLPGVTEAFEAE